MSKLTTLVPRHKQNVCATRVPSQMFRRMLVEWDQLRPIGTCIGTLTFSTPSRSFTPSWPLIPPPKAHKSPESITANVCG